MRGPPTPKQKHLSLFSPAPAPFFVSFEDITYLYFVVLLVYLMSYIFNPFWKILLDKPCLHCYFIWLLGLR